MNLSLNIISRREDGYHNLNSFAAFTSYGGQLTISDDKPEGLTISGPFSAELQDNLNRQPGLKAKRIVLAAGFTPRSHHIHIEKIFLSAVALVAGQVMLLLIFDV